jgi:hypothetical protein
MIQRQGWLEVMPNPALFVGSKNQEDEAMALWAVQGLLALVF